MQNSLLVDSAAVTDVVKIPPPKEQSLEETSAEDLVASSRLRLPVVVVFHDPFALERACESIVFLIRDPAHITPNNIEVSCTSTNPN